MQEQHRGSLKAKDQIAVLEQKRQMYSKGLLPPHTEVGRSTSTAGGSMRERRLSDCPTL
jgi:hypothetical protein